MAKIKMIGYLRELTNVREKTIMIEKPTKLRNAIFFPENLNGERLIILVNGKSATLDTIIKDEDKIVIMPIVGGG